MDTRGTALVLPPLPYLPFRSHPTATYGLYISKPRSEVFIGPRLFRNGCAGALVYIIFYLYWCIFIYICIGLYSPLFSIGRNCACWHRLILYGGMYLFQATDFDFVLALLPSGSFSKQLARAEVEEVQTGG